MKPAISSHLLAFACGSLIAGSLSAQTLPDVKAQQTPPGTVITAEVPKIKMALQQAPANAPNIVIVLLDDVGFAAASTFGGPIPTPALDRLAQRGLRYNRFHTAAICSPTRASLLTGRNPHAVGVGAVLNTPSAYAGYSGLMPKSAATIAEILRQNGYNTAAFGKWHLAPEWESSPAGPFDRWPLRQGFEHFYGFLPAEVDQFAPALVQDSSPVPTPLKPNYHVTEDLADRAIAWMQRHRSIAPTRPFFTYFATGAAHAPLQVPRNWIDRFRGQFDQGWDRLREQSFARQKELGVIPANTQLTARPAEIPAWETMSPTQRRVSSRLMETYAGFLAHTDAQVGRMLDALLSMGAMDNTIFIYIVGDNGGSGESEAQGSMHYMANVQGVRNDSAEMLAHLNEIGGPDSHVHAGAGWSWAMNTPFQWMKQIASHLGGIRNPMVVSWPEGIKDAGGLRQQFAFVSDIAPTLLEAAGIAIPAVVNGVAQQPVDGVSLLPSFADAKAPSARRTQYFNVYGNRSIYHDGWMASAFRGRAPWMVRQPITRPTFEDRWELYNLEQDFSQSQDLAKENPAKLQELQSLFWVEAGRNQVLPLIDNVQGEGLPHLSQGRKQFQYFAGSRGIPEMQAPPVMFRSHTITANVNLPRGAGGGVVAAYGGVAGGWVLHVDRNRRARYSYKFSNNLIYTLVSKSPLPAGDATIAVNFDYSKPMTGQPATAVMMINGKDAGRVKIEKTMPFLFSIHETFDIGIDTGGPVIHDYQPDVVFDGTIGSVNIEIR